MPSSVKEAPLPFCRSPLPELPERGRRHSLSDIPQVLAPNEEGMLDRLDLFIYSFVRSFENM
jgi:hypothetical protein